MSASFGEPARQSSEFPFAADIKQGTIVPPHAHELHGDLQKALMVAKFMDSQFSLFGVKFGADAIAGLIPVVGDTLTLVPALYPIYLAKKHSLGRTVLMRMGLNIGVDWLVGLVPIIGDVLDVATKSNMKNVQLLHRAAEKRR
jgi:hypothetical protein